MFAHFFGPYRAMPNTNPGATNGNFTYITAMPGGMPLPPAMPQGIPLPPQPMYPRYPLPPPQHPHPGHLDNFPGPPIAPLPAPVMPPEMMQSPDYSQESPDGLQSNYPSPMMHNQSMGMNQNGLMVPVAERYYGRYGGIAPIHEDPPAIQYPRPEYPPQVYPSPNPIPYQAQENLPLPNMFVPVQHEPPRNISPYSFDDLSSELISDYRVKPPYAPARERRPDAPWATNDVFSFDGMRNTLPHCSATSEDQELEEELQALERRIDTEFKSTD